MPVGISGSTFSVALLRSGLQKQPSFEIAKDGIDFSHGFTMPAQTLIKKLSTGLPNGTFWVYFLETTQVVTNNKKGNGGMQRDIFQEEFEDFENLPDATEQLKFIAPAVVEVLAGVRTVEQLSPMLSENIYLKLRDRAARAAKSRAESGSRVERPNLVVRNLHQESNKPGVIQSVVLLSSSIRTRAVAIRLESRNRRWLATAVSIL
jgi:hypothetical protein